MSVDEQSPRCDTYYSDREMTRAVRGGTETLQAAREKYSPLRVCCVQRQIRAPVGQVVSAQVFHPALL